MAAPENKQPNSELLAPLIEHLEEITRSQSKLNNYQAALAERKSRKETQLSALDARIACLTASYTGSETDVLIQLGALRSAKAEIPELIDELTPVPVLDLAAIGEELRASTKRLCAAESVLLTRIYDYYHNEARSKLAQTYGEDESSDPPELNREKLAAASPMCRRIDSLIDKLPTTFIGVVDPAANYAATYQRGFEQTKGELELVNCSELPPARVVEPERPRTPIIADRWVWKRPLAPTGWAWGSEEKRA
jgi:hypothetical protein